jgi:o-succinylbenzoate---CoA ligase
VSHSPSLAESATAAAAATPASVAIVDGPIRWSWEDLDRRASRIAANLHRAGVGLGDRVAMLAGPSAAAVAALHGVARAGAVIAPLDPRSRHAELLQAIEIGDPLIVILGPGSAAEAGGTGRRTIELASLLDDVSRADDGARWVATDPMAPAAIVLTSGTTARPKAVVLSASAMAASAAAWTAALRPATGWLLALGLDHVAGLGVVWRAAATARPLVVVASRDPAAIAAALERDPRPSHISVVPTILERLLDVAGDRPAPVTVRAVLVGGGPIPPRLISRAVASGWPVVPTYGLSEAGSGVTALPSDEAASHPDSAGRALTGVRLRIADPDTDGMGEIQVDSPARFSGYLGDPVGTVAAWTNDGWLRTGDIGSLDDAGRLFVADRRTDRIVRGGLNISPYEIEAVLTTHPAVAEAAVVARRDPTFGQVPVAAIVLAEGRADPGDADLAAHCRDRLAAAKVPVAFTRLAALPRTRSGKIRRSELRTRLAAQHPAVDPDPRWRAVDRPDGLRLWYATHGRGPIHALLLHGTLSTADQLDRLAAALAASGEMTVHAVDRRGSGRSRLVDPGPTDVDVHVRDAMAVLDDVGAGSAVLVGVSYGAIVALEAAARVADRVLAVVAYEPPYGAVADPPTRRAFAAVAAATERAYGTGGPMAAAEAFIRGVAGDAAWDRLPQRARASLAGEGAGALVDAALLGLDPARLARIAGPVTILTGDASEPFYEPIAQALCDRIPGARLVRLPGARHASPITDPIATAAAIMTALGTAGVLRGEAAQGGQADVPAHATREPDR